MHLAAHTRMQGPRNDDETDSPTPSEAGELYGESADLWEGVSGLGALHASSSSSSSPTLEADSAAAQLESIARCGKLLPMGLPASTHPEVLRGNWVVKQCGWGTRYEVLSELTERALAEHRAMEARAEKEARRDLDTLAVAAMVEDDQPPLASTAVKRLLPPALHGSQRLVAVDPRVSMAQQQTRELSAFMREKRVALPARGAKRVVNLPQSCVLPAGMLAAARQACGELPLEELEKVARAMWARKCE